MTHSEASKAWGYLISRLCEILAHHQTKEQASHDDQILISVSEFIRLDTFSEQFREAIDYLLSSVVRLLDDNKFRLSRNDKSITTIHLLVGLHDATQKKAIIEKLFYLIKTQPDCLECFKQTLADNKSQLWAVAGKLLKRTVEALTQLQVDEGTKKNLFGVMGLVQGAMPRRMAMSLAGVV